jgi:uncharacterized protein YqgC (DUF456 family)
VNSPEIASQADLLFFMLEAVSICLVVRRYCGNWNCYQSTLIGAFMALLGRVTVAAILHIRPPLFDCPLYIPIYLVIWVLMNCAPFDVVYRVLNTRFFQILSQFRSLLQARSVLCGVDLAPSEFSLVGKVVLGVLLSSQDSVVWLLFAEGTREFWNGVIVRNAAAAGAYAWLSQSQCFVSDTVLHELFWVVFGVITVVEICVHGVSSRIGIDVTFLTRLAQFARC